MRIKMKIDLDMRWVGRKAAHLRLGRRSRKKLFGKKCINMSQPLKSFKQNAELLSVPVWHTCSWV